MAIYDKEELRVGIKNLLEEKRDLLLQTRNAPLYLDELETGLAALDADAGSKVVEKRARVMEADREHDSHVRFLRRWVEAARLDPALDEAGDSRLERVLEIVPKASDRARTLAEEIALAQSRAAKLPEYEADLAAVPLLGGRTLLDAFRGYLAAASALDQVSSQEASASAAKPDGQQISKLRNRLIRVVHEFRDAVENEVARDPRLPRNLPQQAFSYFIGLDQRREQRGKPKEKPEEASN